MCGARKGESKTPAREKRRGEKHTSRSFRGLLCAPDILIANKPESVFIKRNKKEKERKRRGRKEE